MSNKLDDGIKSPFRIPHWLSAIRLTRDKSRLYTIIAMIIPIFPFNPLIPIIPIIPITL